VPARGPVPRELDESKRTGGEVFHLLVLGVVGERVAADARRGHLTETKTGARRTRCSFPERGTRQKPMSEGARREAEKREKEREEEEEASIRVVSFWASSLLFFFLTLSLFSMPADEEERAAAGPSGASAPAAADEQPGPSSAAPSPAQPTRPSIKRRRNLRQTRVNAVGDDDAIDVKGASAAPSIDHAALLEDTRALQRMRSKRTVSISDRNY